MTNARTFELSYLDLSGLVQQCMNIDSDNTLSPLLQLLQKFDPTFSIPSGNRSTSGADAIEAGTFGVGSDATSSKPIYKPGTTGESNNSFAPNLSTFSRTVSFTSFNPRFSVASGEKSSTGDSSQTAQSFNFGEIHAVQERFHSLLKQRLRMEYENNLPLFPWETEVGEYPADTADTSGQDLVAATAVSAFWSKQVGKLKVPGLLPVPVLNALLEQCQALSSSYSKQGVRLVKAVESLFPGQGQMLEPIANMVLVPAYRSDGATQAAVTQELIAVAGDYDSAQPEQQIALSMLAAQEILNALTLSVSCEEPEVTRDWVTATGLLQLKAAVCEGQLKVSAILPEGGSIRLWDSELDKKAQRPTPGKVALSWDVSGSEYLCFLEVSLSDKDELLNFTVQLTDA